LAAQTLADLAQTVSEDSLILTLEKTVMSDRQVRRSILERSSTGGNRGRSEPWSSSRPPTGSNSSNTLNLIATGSSGAIISGLEDDYFEVRCATLATVTRIASLSARFAANCQDLLVDMLTDDIQEVRLSAIRALGAVGDQVPLQSEQVAIITSALAEGSGRTRRRLHQLLSRCCLASAPCLISLLDGLLHNLRRYPQDRDSLWRCAASVGRRHSVFVETCLSSLLRTHLWLSGPDPSWEDPAYLTVLLLVFNAEPGAPGMQAQFPRHLAATKVYLAELVPSLIPRRRNPIDLFPNPDPFDRSLTVPSKRRRLDLMGSDLVTELEGDARHSDDSTSSNSLLRFLYSMICRVIGVLDDLRRPFAEPSSSANQSECPFPTLSRGLWNQQLAVLTRLVFADLCGSVQRLDRIGQWKGLIQWLTMLTTLGWCLACVGTCYPSDSPLSVTTTTAAAAAAAKPVAPLMRKPGKLLSRALQMGLKALHLFSGKTDLEQSMLVQLVAQLVAVNKLFRLDGCVSDMHLWASTIQSVVGLLSQLISTVSDSKDTAMLGLGERNYAGETRSIHTLNKSAKRLQPVYVALLQPITAGYGGVGVADLDVFGFGRVPLGTTSFSNRWSEDADDGWTPTSRVAADQVNVTIPEIRFTASIGSVSIRIRAVVFGMNLAMVRQRVCVLFRRPDLPAGNAQADGCPGFGGSHDLWTALFHQWWPPAGAWHPLDEGFTTTTTTTTTTTDGTRSDHDVYRVELRTHLELSAGRWSDAGTVEIGLGYCLPASHIMDDASATALATSTESHYDSTDSKPSLVIPLISRKMLARVRLLPSAPIGQW
uniref:Integrator complex subunit 4 n=1 Tax=Echinostoma caproni TaxID=27848 RepID=A0A183AMN4_9TREM